MRNLKQSHETRWSSTNNGGGVRRAIRVVLLCLLLLGPVVLIGWLIDMRWLGWVVFGILLLTAVVLLVRATRPRLVNAYGGKRGGYVLPFLVALIALYVTVVLFRPDPAVSFAGTVVREGIRSVVQSPLFEGGLLAQGDRMKYDSRWTAPEGYVNQRFELNHCAVEWLQPTTNTVSVNDNETVSDTAGTPGRVVYQLHGGGYVYGFSDMYRTLAMRWSGLTNGAAVVSLDYRFAPAHTFPTALEDALEGWHFMLEQGYAPQKILVVGDSAGGNLALALVLKLRDEGYEVPGAVVVMSPWADMSAVGASHTGNLYRDPMFGIPKGTPIPKEALPPVYAGAADLTDPYLSPVYATFEDFPPMLIQVGTEEVLLSDSQTVHKKAIAAGSDATLTVYPGMFHMFQLFGDMLPESRAAWNEVASFLSTHFLQ